MQYFFEPELPNGVETLNEVESAHCIKVFRHKEGDKIGLLDGKGGIYAAFIKHASPRKTSFEIAAKQLVPPPEYRIHLSLAPTKHSDRMEWLVEKLTEIGVWEISLIISQNSERRKYRIDRLQKKIVSALKQSKNPYAPKLNAPEELDALIENDQSEQKFIAYVDLKNPQHLKHLAKPKKSYSIVIGPEGDFTKKELQACTEAGYQKISLGGNVLRTETAGLVAVNILHLINT